MTPQSARLTDRERVEWLRLIRSRRVGPATFARLLGEHGSARAALEALPEIARAAGVEGYTPCPEAVAEAEYRRGVGEGFRLLCTADPEYPALLREAEGAPPVLWALGRLDLLAAPAVALVGARNASALGARFAGRLARELGEAGLVIVSGLARGIDTAAHKAALATGTIGVQAGGLDVAYPAENIRLHQELAERGLRLSEQPLGLEPQARHFPQRNRIIAALARATIVVEGAMRSGSLLTAREAGELGRDVLAVPGHPSDPRASGCNALLREGATLVRSAADVLEALGPLARQAPRRDTASETENGTLKAEAAGTARPAPSTDDAGALKARILALLSTAALAEDLLIRDIGLPAAVVSPALVTLEMEGRILRQPGGMLALSA